MKTKNNEIIYKMNENVLCNDQSQNGFWNLNMWNSKGEECSLDNPPIDVTLTDICDVGENFQIKFQFDGTDADFFEKLKEIYLNYDPVAILTQYEKEHNTVYYSKSNQASVVIRIHSHLMLLLSDFGEKVIKPCTKPNSYNVSDDIDINNTRWDYIANLFKRNGWNYDDHFVTDEGQIVAWHRPLGHSGYAYCAILYDGTMKDFIRAFKEEVKNFTPNDCIRYYRYSIRDPYSAFEDEVKLVQNALAVEESYKKILFELEKRYSDLIA